MTPVAWILCLIGGLVVGLCASWCTDRDSKRYRRPRVAAAWNAVSAAVCIGAACRVGGWPSAVLVVAAAMGVGLAARAAGQAWSEHKMRRVARIVAEIQRDAEAHRAAYWKAWEEREDGAASSGKAGGK